MRPSEVLLLLAHLADAAARAEARWKAGLHEGRASALTVHAASTA